MDHELQYGFQYKDASVTSLSTYGDSGVVKLYRDGQDVNAAVLYREGNAAADVEYTSVSVQDTITFGNWTFKAGLRYDRQEGNNIASTVRGSAFAPELLPDLSYAGGETPFTWDTIAPRLGATYSWGDENQYLFRGSLAQFYDTLGSGFITPDNPVNPSYSYHSWTDTNGNGDVDQGELGASLADNINRPVNAIDPDLKAPKVDELVVGFEWAVNPEFTLGITGTLRERSDTTWTTLNGDLDPAVHFDKVENTVVDPNTGNTVDSSYYVLNAAGAAALNANNTILTNRPDYSEDFFGIELTATKRLSNRWMMRANLAWQDWTRNVGKNAVQDPNHFQSGINEDGGAMGVQSAGSGNRANIFYGSSTWTANINGLYQMPWDLTISANINAREGYALPYADNVQYNDAAGFNNNTFVAIGAFDATRADDLFWADFKLTKTFSLGGRTKVELAAEVFNAFNDDTILARELNASTTRAGEPVEVMAPRVGRFSATVHF